MNTTTTVRANKPTNSIECEFFFRATIFNKMSKTTRDPSHIHFTRMHGYFVRPTQTILILLWMVNRKSIRAQHKIFDSFFLILFKYWMARGKAPIEIMYIYKQSICKYICMIFTVWHLRQCRNIHINIFANKWYILVLCP